MSFVAHLSGIQFECGPVQSPGGALNEDTLGVVREAGSNSLLPSPTLLRRFSWS